MPDRNSNTSLENRALFSSTFSESVIENRTPQGSSQRTCTIFEHRSGFRCAKFDHLARGIQAFLADSPKYDMTFAITADFLKTVCYFRTRFCNIWSKTGHVDRITLRHPDQFDITEAAPNFSQSGRKLRTCQNQICTAGNVTIYLSASCRRCLNSSGLKAPLQN